MKKILKWLDNFWYHYKWRTIIITFFAALFIFCTVQCSQKTDPDISVIYVGPEVISAEMYAEMETVLESRLDEDYNGDGERHVQITDVVLLSDEQLAQKKEEAAKDDQYLYYDTSTRQSTFEKAKNWMVGGEMLICVLDPYMYELCSGQNLFMPLSEYLDEIPAYAHDEYSLVFSEIPFVQYFDALKPISENTLLCIVNPTVLSALSGNDEMERYDAHIALVKKMLAFSLA